MAGSEAASRQKRDTSMKQVLRCLVDVQFLMDFRSARLAVGQDVDVWAEMQKSRILMSEFVQAGLVEEKDLADLVRPGTSMFTAVELDLARGAYEGVLLERSEKLKGTDIQRRILVGHLHRIAVLVTELAYWSNALPAALGYGPKSMRQRSSNGEPVTSESIDYLRRRVQRANELRDPEAVLAAAQKMVDEGKAAINRIKRRGQAARRATKRRSARSSARSVEATAD